MNHLVLEDLMMGKQLQHSLLLALLLSLMTSGIAGAKLVGWWKFDDGTGTTALDSFGNEYHGTINGTPQWVAGQLGGALQFNGSNNHVDCGVIPIATNGTGAISVCAWVNRAVAGDNKLASNRQVANAPGGGFTVAIYNDRMEMDISDATGRVLSRDANRPAVPGVNTWVHLAWVYSDAADTLQLYINGILSTTATVTQSVGLSTQFFRIGADSPSLGLRWNGMVDDLRLYDHALSAVEVADAMKGIGPSFGQATNPTPADGATDVLRDTDLAWTAGEFAATHDVYLGTAFTDVNDAGRTDPKGVLVSQGQTATTYQPAALLDFGQTYYWRIDEVNAPPSTAIFQGGVWSFTVEPYAYPISNITATASSAKDDNGPENTVNGSGLNPQDQHSTIDTDMWLSLGTPPNWIQYEFDQVYKLHELRVWNYNHSFESFIGWGARDVTIEYSLDGETWTELEDVPEFAQGTGQPTYTHGTTVSFDGVFARFVKLTINSNWGTLTPVGLSEVRFFQVPVQAREPVPADGATGVAVDTSLGWRPGREAESHKVYLATDADAVAAGTAPAADRTQRSYTPPALNLGTTYFWRVDEVGETGTFEGNLWSFTTQEFLVVDDFESYDDQENRIYQVWIDGEMNKTGSQVGYLESDDGTFGERTIVHSGRQSMPLFYDNSGTTVYSEAERTFAVPQDWTKHGHKTLSLAFYGDRDNTGQMYLKIDNTKVPYGGGAEDIKRTQWQPWHVDLAATGANLKSVTRLAIGIEGAGAAGTLRFDDIRLYGSAPEFVTPVDPGTAGLVAWYKFDGNLNDSRGAHHGTAVGDATTVADPIRGQVLTLDGVGDGVKVPLLAASTNTLTIAMWANTTVDPLPIQFASFFHGDGWAAGDLHWRYSYGRVNAGINGVADGDLGGRSIVKSDQWNHVAVTVSPTELALWLNGLKEASRTLPTPATVILGEGMIGAWLETDGVTITRGFTGRIDDARFYDRALSPEELASLAGRTEPFYKPFP
jgi:hypothetical protein